MIEMMVGEAPGEVIIRDFLAAPMSEEIVLVTYRSVGMSGQEARRSSVWIRVGDRWQLRHHQGTRVPDRWGRLH
jgi:ribonuclease HI